MKHHFPVLTFVALLTVYLAGQAYLNSKGLATPSRPPRETYAHYEASLKDASFQSVDGKTYLQRKLPARGHPQLLGPVVRPCLEEFPSLVSMKKRFKDSQVLVLGINTDEEKPLEKITRVKKRYRLNFPVTTDLPVESPKNS